MMLGLEAWLLNTQLKSLANRACLGDGANSQSETNSSEELQEAAQAVLASSTQCFLHHKNSVSAVATTNFTPLLVK